MGSLEHIKIELSSVIILIFAGMILGVGFDFYRIFRCKIKPTINPRFSKFFDILGDFLFWGAALVVITPLVFWSTWLELRVYVWLLLIVGLVVYFTIFCPVFVPWYLRFWNIVSWLLKIPSKSLQTFAQWQQKLKSRR